MKQQPPPIWGVWKLRSVEVSSQTPMPGLTNSITVFTQREDGIHYIADSVYSNGLKTHVECSLRLDGQTYAVTGSMFGDELSARQTAPDTIEAAIYREGRITASIRLSVRGAVLISDWQIVQEQGPPIVFSTISDRQE